MNTKTALITGITGQDGAYLAEFLLNKGYEVHGLKRRSSLFNTQRVDHLYQDQNETNTKFKLHYGDLSDATNLIRVVEKVAPDEIYNLGAMSHVKVSFDVPEYVADVDGIGTLRLLEALRILKCENKTKFYQASTSELYGKVVETPQRETTPFYPRSPYGVAKLYAYWIVVNYREAYNMYACNGILFNHESPLRGETFVSRKITRGISRMARGLQNCLYMGNIDSKRDWGHAKDYIEAMWLMLQQKSAEDFVISTGVTTSIRDFILKAFANIKVKVEFSGTGLSEVAKVVENNNPKFQFKIGQEVIKISPQYFRPTEVDLLLGDSSKARKSLGWKPRYDLDMLIDEMMTSDLTEAKKEKILLDHGHKIYEPFE
jgi:GDPmannose 4,6-dehydratase